MHLPQWKAVRSGEWRQATLCFLLKGDEVLLAMNKRGFGVGEFLFAGDGEVAEYHLWEVKS